jgi:hypothetical protein
VYPRAELGGGSKYGGRADVSAAGIDAGTVSAGHDAIVCYDWCDAPAAGGDAGRDRVWTDIQCGRAECRDCNGNCADGHRADGDCGGDCAECNRVECNRASWHDAQHEHPELTSFDFIGGGCPRGEYGERAIGGECAIGTRYFLGARSSSRNAVAESGAVLAVLERRGNRRHRLLPRSVLSAASRRERMPAAGLRRHCFTP